MPFFTAAVAPIAQLQPAYTLPIFTGPFAVAPALWLANGIPLAVLSFAVFVLTLLIGCGIGYQYYLRPRRLLLHLGDSQESNQRPGMGARVRGLLNHLVAGQLGSVMPLSAADSTVLRRELRLAGFREESSVRAYSSIRILACLVFVIVGLLAGHLVGNPTAHLLIPAAGLAVGIFAPSFVLGWLVDRRQERIRQGLADALDLLVICCEAGCGLDQAINTVARDFKRVHPDLSDELSLLNMETLAGVNRTTALRNFASRTTIEEVRKLVALLIQTDRFGTSIADALRTQADYLRVRRRQAAEERAGKVGVKLVFPIFFFFMPALMVFVAGPGILSMIQTLKEIAGSQ
ncbi:MAG: type II secretion system F family protein [Bryobacteraceae bacterium]